MAKAFRISDYVQPEEERSKVDHMEITPVPIQLIDANWQNFYSVDTIEEDLAESIEVSGLLTPLGVVAKDGGRYKLISGHRRLRALKYLHDSRPGGRETWAVVPCVIYDSPEDADREELMLIHANAQRVKSGPEIAREAQKTTEILTRMKERGVELPGRMRDRVAEALQVSSTRLARLEAIEHNLTYPGWEQKWKEQKITEAVAYRLSQLDYSQQMNAADWMIDHHITDTDVTVKHVEEALAHPPLTNPGCADPLFYEEDPVKVDRELVRRANFARQIRYDGLTFENRKDAMDKLKKKYRWTGYGSAELDWDGEPKGVRFKKPIEWLLGWGAMYDALAANALDAAIEGAATGAAGKGKDPSTPLRSAQDDKRAADPMTAPTVTVSDSRWRSCRDDPPEGWALAFKFYPWDTDSHDFDLELVQYHDGKWWGVFDNSDDELEITMYDLWMPAAPPPAEVWE